MALAETEPVVTGSDSDESLPAGIVTGQDVDVSFVFVSGNPALDFAGTLKWRRAEPEELLQVPHDLDRWLVDAGLLSSSLGSTAADIRNARTLREAIYRLALGRSGEGRVMADRNDVNQTVADRVVVNRFAVPPPVALCLTDMGVSLSGTIEHALADIARSAINVVADPTVTVKECGRDECTRLFVDASRGARRTWCGMDECGNRINAANYRARKRS
jgi:predicted RNA-binding Zn ribbon-like protein